MRCPRCGGHHDGSQPPPVNTKIVSPVSPLAARDFIKTVLEAGRSDPYDRDVLPGGKPGLWEPRIYGTDESGNEVTVVTGVPRSSKDSQVLAARSHVPGWEFYVHNNHDHFGSEKSKDRGKS